MIKMTAQERGITFRYWVIAILLTLLDAFKLLKDNFSPLDIILLAIPWIIAIVLSFYPKFRQLIIEHESAANSIGIMYFLDFTCKSLSVSKRDS